MDITKLTALQQAEAIAQRKVGARELLDAHIAKVEAHNASVYAFDQVFVRWARKHADRIDANHRRWPDPLPTFWGVPLAIKDNDPMRFTFTKLGSRAYRWVWTPFDSPAVRRLRAAGFVMLGKTTTSEFALLPTVEVDIHPPTRNPADPSRTAGGSSGGSAAAVAMDMVAIAHGADGGGSIRIPAAFCGLFGFKASRGAMPHFYGPFESVELSVAGTLARSVEDAAAAVDALGGRPTPNERNLLRTPWTEDRELRVCFTTESQIADVSPEIADAVRRVAAYLESMGATVEESPPFDGGIDEFTPVYGRLAANLPVLRESALQPTTRWLREIGKTLTNREARRITDALAGRLRAWFGDADLWVLPTVGCRPPAVGATAGLDPAQAFRSQAELGAFTAPFNITGQPAASIPVGNDSLGLPMGVQVVGQHGADELVLHICRELARAGAWVDHAVRNS